MEIKELKPSSKEIVIGPKDGGVLSDAFSYEIQNPLRSGNGKRYLYIVSQTQSEDASLDYIPNLVASFIKRELESNLPGQTGNNSQDEEQIFEKALKKSNELVDGLLKDNSGLKLDLGAALINKEKISVSKIGRAKMLVNRPKTGETFDVFENVTQFNKSHIYNKRFSNMISGEIKNGDKFFFFVPNNRLNPKQKQITAALVKSSPGAFAESIRKMIAPPAHCCGIYFEINEELKKVAEEKTNDKEAPVVATEVAKISRSDTLKRTTDKFKKMVMGDESDDRKWKLIKPRGVSSYFIVAVIAFFVVTGLIFLTKGNPKFKKELGLINENLKVSESRFLLKQTYEARKFLNEAFAELGLLQENKNKESAYLAAVSLLNRIEKINTSAKPALSVDLTKYQNADLNGLKDVLVAGGKLFINDSAKIYAVQEEELKQIEGTTEITLTLAKDNKIVLYGNGIKIIDLGNNKISELKKKFGFEPVEFKNYEDNLYFLGSKNIYKISNALVKPGQELEWLKSSEAAKIPGNFTAFDLDSSVYALTDERKLVIMFKGGITKTIDLDFDVRGGTELINLGNKELLVVDKEMKLARVISDAAELKVSYDLSDVESIKSVFLDKESRTLYLLSPAKIWSLKI